jgi:hypothetical protein
MSKGAIIDEAFIHALGLSGQLMTLTGHMENKHHPALQESLFHLRVAEVPEIIYLERKYVFDNQVSIKSTYGKDDKILVWLQRVLRANTLTAGKESVDLLMVRDMFLLGDWREFQRFKQFVKSMRILDAQARNYLAEHHQEFPSLANDSAGIERILDSLEKTAEWPDLDGNNSKASSLELVAKTYSKDLAPIRASALLAGLLLKRAPDVRFNLFRLLSFVEDPAGGSDALVQFLIAIGAATRDPETVENTAQIQSGRDLQRAFTAIRKYLFSSKMPDGGMT